MESVGPGEGRISRFERIFCPAAMALAVAQDSVDDARVGNKGDDAQVRATRIRHRAGRNTCHRGWRVCGKQHERERESGSPLYSTM